MYAFWNFFLRQNKFSYLLLVSLLGFGVFALVDIPKESSPEIQIPIGIVSTTLPGASAADVEQLVTNRIERRLSGNLENLRSLTSTSREGVSTVVAEFSLSADLDRSIQELKDEVDKIRPDLPTNANDPVVLEVNFADQPIMTIAASGEKTDAEFSVFADAFKREIEGVPGVSRIESSGVREREVTVVVEETALAQYGLSIADVISGIRAANLTVPVGSITTDGVRYAVAFDGDIATPEEVRDVPIGAAAGQPIFVRDVARVNDGLGESVTLSRLSVDGSPAAPSISFDVYKRRGGDITRITGAVSARIAELQEANGMFEGFTMQTVLDNGDLIKQDLTRLSRSGLQTVGLVILLLIIAIGWREALVAGAAIPLSFLIGFIGLYASGNTINFISLFALILAVGILVDSAIVMVEGINRRMKENPSIDKTEAARETLREFAKPLIAGTLTTVAMFSGLFLVGGISGEFISAIPFTINFVLFASLLVALGFIPLIASLFLRRRSATRIEQKQTEYAKQLEAWYRNKLERIIGNRTRERIFLWLISAGFILAIAMPIFGVVKVIFFEQEDIEWMYAQIELPQGTPQEVTDLAARRFEEVLYTEPDIASFVTTVGMTSPFADFNNVTMDPKYASYFINLRADRQMTSLEISASLREKSRQFNDFLVTVGQPDSGPPTGDPIVIRFLGDDLDELSRLAIDASRLLDDIPGTTGITTSTDTNSTEFVLTLDKARAAAFGFTPQQISQTLRSTVFGTEATSITTDGEDIDIIVKLDLNPAYVDPADTNAVSIAALENITLTSPSGDSVPLSALTTTSVRESSTAIRHDDRKRIVSVSGGIEPGANLREILATFQQRAPRELSIPESVEVAYGGETEEADEAFRDMFLALIVGVLLMLAILVLQFNSYRHTMYVLSILPFSLIGIMFGLALTQKALSFPSLMGFIALSGIVVNNSILLIDRMNSNRRANPDGEVRNAVIDAAVSRLRPILLTTLTTVIGVFPLTFASDLWSPLAYAIMFGLSFSVIITLLLVPIIYNRKPGVLTPEK